MYSFSFSRNCSIQSYSSTYALRKKCPYSKLFWSAFSRIRTEYFVSLRIQSECGKMWNRITLNAGISHTVMLVLEWPQFRFLKLQTHFSQNILFICCDIFCGIMVICLHLKHVSLGFHIYH